MPTDTTEKGLESLIVGSLVEDAGYLLGRPEHYDREHALDLPQLLAFLKATQPQALEAIGVQADGPARQQFLHRLQGEVSKRGVIDVLRKGIKHGPASIDLYYGTPTPGNDRAAELHAVNRCSITRQVRYSNDERQLALDLVLFVNGLPLATFELKNSLTKQTTADAINQYKHDRDPNEVLFQLGRCAVHFAVDDQQVWMCTHLSGKDSWFLPFNKGHEDGAGNPPNPHGIKTDYLWKSILTRRSLANIVENYAQVIEERDNKARVRRRQVFPRYHQLHVVRKLLADAQAHGAGKRYLVQHSAGSGKSNSITWLVHQLVDLKRAGEPVFDSVIVITDRTVLDKQIRDNIRQFAQVSAVVGAVTQGSGQLRTFIEQGKKIVISTIQKFPEIVDAIGDQHRDRRFAIIIDEAHSSQGGRTSAAVHAALAEEGEGDDETNEDRINRVMETRKVLKNASYFAFTATPKNKTLQIFGDPQADGTFRPFHSYTMKQAIEEGFILDVLKSYTPVASYYRLMKKVEEDPEFDVRKAQRKLRKYVESHDHAIRQKAEIMIDHFHDRVVAAKKLGGKARAMVVTSGIARALQYKAAFDAYLAERASPYKAIVAFSGEQEVDGQKVTEAALNGFASAQIPERFREDPYRFLIVADKFQTGYDEPLLHTMYVDKVLSGIKAVQTLSRLNRAHPQKQDTFILDFMNDVDTVQLAFADYYRTTVLSEATDPDKLHDLKADLDGYQVYAWPDVETVSDRFLAGAKRDELDPVLDACVALYNTELDEEDQVDFKGKAKSFVRTYHFLSSVLPYSNASWERLSIFLNFLVPKLPAPKEEDLSRGILETIDMDSYRVEVRAQTSIALPDADAEIDPVPTGGGGGKPEPTLDRLSNIVRAFNDQFGNIEWKDKDKINQVISEEIPAKVAADKAYQNAIKHSDKQNARIEHDNALQRVMMELLADHTELFKQFSDNPGFKKWLSDTIFRTTYQKDEPRPSDHTG